MPLVGAPHTYTVKTMSEDKTMIVEVAYALPEKQAILEVEIVEGASVLEAVRHALRLAHAHGRQAAIFCADPATARRMADEGFDLVVAGIDLGWAASGAASALAGVRGAS